MEIIRVLSGRFLQLKAQHIYKAYNKEVDQLSKEALLVDDDGIYYAVGNEGNSTNFERLIAR
jgi:hypothetical protein